jgi:hypothetical protein
MGQGIRANNKPKIARERGMKHSLNMCAFYMAALSAAIIFGNVTPAAAASFNVANDGADSATCGAETSPCRSISQAITNASDGDTIVVGAGLYGNISGNPNFGGPGDEQPSRPFLTQGCIICVTKAVRIFSIHGAAVTIIQGSATTPYRSNVMIFDDGVTFGREGGGFTITGGNDNGLSIVDQAQSIRNVTVAGNVDVGDMTGFSFVGVDLDQIGPCPTGACPQTAHFLLSDNQAIGNGSGFKFRVNLDGAGQLIARNNLTVGAGVGFAAIPGCSPCESTVNAPANIVQLIDNVAVNGGVGFSTNLSGLIQGNTASGNSQVGFLITPGISQIFQSNSAIGNAGPGVVVQFSPDEATLQFGSFASFSNNNLYGNDRNRPPMLSVNPIGSSINVSPQGGYNPGPGAQCGVLNLGALAALTVGGVVSPSPVIKLQAGNNFWGSVRGPLSNGPGDAVGGVCDQNGGVTLAKPFATVAFGITSWP